jgi:hypothetical protein
MVDYGADGTPVQAVPAIGYHFVDWSDGSTANPRTDANVTADLNVTATFASQIAAPHTPNGILSAWNYNFTWTGIQDATWYLIEVETSGGTQVYYKWYTCTQTNCAGGTACSVTATGLSLTNGDYKWRAWPTVGRVTSI